MAGISGVTVRKSLVVTVFLVVCTALVLFCARLGAAEPMEASWYGPGFEGNLTASGEVFDPSQYTAAHKTLDFGTKLIVTYEGRSVVVRINDRGPYIVGRDLDLSQGAAEYIGLTSVGVALVDVETADASTPVGPYAPQTADNAAKPQVQDSDNGGNNGNNDPRPQSNQGAANNNAAEDEEQYAEADQYAAEDQYAEVTAAEVEPPPPAPKPVVPVLPPEPEPEALIAPPEELVVPNSTIQKRVELDVAAPPKPEPAPEPAPEPEVVEAEEEVEEITVLPDTGGASPAILAAGVLLLGSGLTIRLMRR